MVEGCRLRNGLVPTSKISLVQAGPRDLPLGCEKLHFIRGLFLFASSRILEAAAETMRLGCKLISVARRLPGVTRPQTKLSENWFDFDH